MHTPALRHLCTRRILVLNAGLLVASVFILLPLRLRAEGGQAFSISPPLVELQAAPGQTVTAAIKLTNISTSALVMQAQANDFAAKDETGDPKIIFDSPRGDPASIHNWVALPAAFTMASKEVKTINFPIKIPKNAEPGGHYVVIRFTGTPPGLEGSGVALSASIGSLVLLKVSGAVNQAASIVDFYSAELSADDKVLAGKPAGFFEVGPIAFAERIKNAGNIHIKPTGLIQVKDMFGRLIDNLSVNAAATANGKTSSGSILPSSIRRFDQKLDKTWLFGRYTATLTLSYGDPAQTMAQTIVFWVIPYKLITSIIVALLLLFFGLRWGIKRYNKYIIRKAKLSRR